jgi:peptide/nickel transport system permease protein
LSIKYHSKGLQVQAWRRLLKNKGAVIGLFIIVLAFLAAIFAYAIAPDSSPDANTMMLQVGGQPPGFSIEILKFPNPEPTPKVSVLHRLLYGAVPDYEEIPISGYSFSDSSILIQQYVDDETSAPAKYKLEDIIFKKSLVHSLGEMQKYIRVHQIAYKTFWLGTDQYGRDLLSRLLVGTRVSLSVGFVAVLISLSIGILLGAIAGFFQGWVDDVIMWLINVTWSVPTLLLVFAITIAIGKGFWQIFIAVGLTLWISVARIIRGQVLSIKQAQFIEAARALGYGNSRIIFHHILPNILGPVMVIAANNFATAIVIEAGLSFLGIGVQPPMPSWGLMIKENYGFIITHHPMLAIVPGIAIMLLVLAFNLLGNGLRDAMDVKGKL